jgi:hypothetical protein
MAINEAVNIGINVDGTASVEKAANSYEDLGDAVAKTQLEAERLANTFGINDKRTQEAIKVAGQYKQQMEELDFAIDGARGGIDQLFRATQGVVAGFEVAAGAAALFGGESEQLEKVLMKVQGAMVLSQGLKDLKEFAPAMRQATTATLNWVKSLRLARVALAGLGIGAVVLLFQAFKDQLGGIIDFFKDLTDSIGLTNFAQEKQIKTQERAINALNRELAVMEARGDSEEKLFQQRLKIAQAEELLAQQRLALLKEGEDGYEEAVSTAADASNQIVVIQESENKRLRDLQAERLKEAKEKEQERIDFLKDKAESYAQEADTFLNQTQRKRLNDLKSWYDEELKLVIGNTEAEGNLFDLYYKKKKQLADDFANEERGRLAAQLNDAISFFQIFGNLAETFAGENEDRAKKAFLINKGVSIAEAVVNTYTGATAALATKTELYPYERFVRAALVISTGLAQIAQIQRTKYNSASVLSSTTSSGSPSSAVPRFNAPSTRLPGGGDEFTQVRRVYVTERDITNVQDKVKVTESLSQF